MRGKLLDTNAVIALQRGDPALVALLNDTDEWFLNAVVLGELYYGAYRSQRVAENLAVVDRWSVQVEVLPVDSVTARVFGEVHRQLRAKGRPIPENDIWIAATALQYQLEVVSQDDHFREVAGLSLVRW
ncbi:MAG TPA: type II toxin-antitoxin system VapC family toxin [Chloroflexi bacterium]|nr:type II toxin-antitoxin system VapC family toxin [Chloroflexota bacterium]